MWKTDVEDFPVGAHQRIAHALQRPPLRGVASGEEALGRGPRPTSAASSAAASSRSMRRRASRCGRPTPSEEPKPTEEERRRHAALGTVGRAGLGDARRSTRSSTRSTSRPATTTAIRRRRRATRSWRWISRPGKILWSQADDREGRLHRGVPSARQDQLRRVERARLRLRRRRRSCVSLASGRRAAAWPGRSPASCTRSIPISGGEVLWQTRVGRGGTMGGVQWGSATDGTNVYVA